MLILNEESVKDFIKKDRVVVKVWAKNCPYCDRLDDSFSKINLGNLEVGAIEVSHPMDKAFKPSEFKRTWMKMDKSDVVKDTVPAIFVFEKGEVKYRHFGMLYADSLQHWIETGEVIPSKMQQKEKAENDKKQKLYGLFAQKGELTHNLEILSSQLQKINQEIGELLK